MPRPLTHTGTSVSSMLYDGKDIVGELVYIMGDPQRVGIVRAVNVGAYRWDSKILIEWQSGKKVWRHGGSVISMISKIQEERRNLNAFIIALTDAEKHFGVSQKWEHEID
jgi:hypothetical protein